MQKVYKEHKGKVIKTGGKFKLIMAIAINPVNHKEALLRCLVSRTGDITKNGTHDISKLYLLKGKSLTSFSIDKELKIKNSEKILKKLSKKGYEFIGLEDPDIFYDEKKKLFHVYFTLPYIIDTKMNYIHLGHAVGKSLGSLTMTDPVLETKEPNFAAKEISIAPINSKGVRINLFESKDRCITKLGLQNFSTVSTAVVLDMGKPWKFKEVVLHPNKIGRTHKWLAGDASPGPLLPETFINLGKNLRLGILNGCTVGKFKNGKKVFGGYFTTGLFVYDYEHGKILWVSKKPFLKDHEAKRITFASQFIETKPGEGILYAHVDDSFVRAYTLYADKIKNILPKVFHVL